MAKQQPNRPRNQQQFQKLSASIDRLNKNIKAGKAVHKSTLQSTATKMNTFSGTPEFGKLLNEFSKLTRALGEVSGKTANQGSDSIALSTKLMGANFEKTLSTAFDSALKSMTSSAKSGFSKVATGFKHNVTDAMKSSMDQSFASLQSKLKSAGKTSQSLGEQAQRRYDKIVQSGNKIIQQGAERLKQEKEAAAAAFRASKVQQQEIKNSKERIGLLKKESQLREKALKTAKEAASRIPGDLGSATFDMVDRAEKLWNIIKKSKQQNQTPNASSTQNLTRKSGDCCEEISEGLSAISHRLDRIVRIMLIAAKGARDAGRNLGAVGRNPAAGGGGARGGAAGGGGAAGPPLPPGAAPAAATAGGGASIVSRMASLLGRAGPIGAAIMSIVGLVVGAMNVAFNITLGVLTDLNEVSKELAKSMGTSVMMGEKMLWNSYRLIKSEKARYHTVKQIQEAQVAMVKAAGTTNVLQKKGGEELMLQLSELGKLFAYGSDTAAQMHQQFRTMGADDSLAKRLQGNLAVMTELIGIPAADVMKDMAESAEYMSTYLAKSPDQVAKTVFQIRRLGFTMKQTASMTDKVLNLQGFMEDMTEVMAMGGPNLSKVFYKALTGDPTQMLSTVVDAIGGSKAWDNMNYFMRKKVATTVGLGVDELSKAMLMNKRMSELDPGTLEKMKLYESQMTERDLADEASVRAAIRQYELTSSIQRMWDKIRGVFVGKLQPAFAKMADFFNSPAMDGFVESLMKAAGMIGSGGQALADWAMKTAVTLIKGINSAVVWIIKAAQAIDDWSTDTFLGRTITGRKELTKEQMAQREKDQALTQLRFGKPLEDMSKLLDPLLEKFNQFEGATPKATGAIGYLQGQTQQATATAISSTSDTSTQMEKEAARMAAEEMKKMAPGFWKSVMDTIFPWTSTFAGGVTNLRGPGTSTSDSIPARLSVGERVVPANINKQLGGMPNEALPSLVRGYATGTDSVGQDPKRNMDLIVAALTKRGIIEPNLVKAILGNIGKESGFKSQEEDLASYGFTAVSSIRSIFGRKVANYSDTALRALSQDPEKFAEAIYGYRSGAGLGNTVPGDGWNYRGRGFIQLTGKSNYAEASSALGKNLLGNPNLALDPTTAAETAAWFMDKKMGGMAKRLQLPGLKNLSYEQALLLATSTIMGSDARKTGFGLDSMTKAGAIAESLGSMGGFSSNVKDNTIGRNGQLPASSLTRLNKNGIYGQPILLSPKAANAFEGMAAAASASGVDLPGQVTDSYRDLARQKEMAAKYGLYSEGGNAAVPGRSNHGWGLALDINSKGKAGSWLSANASKYGFGTIAREPWHWELRGGSGSKTEEQESKVALSAAQALPSNFLGGNFERRRPYWEGAFANGTEMVNGPGTSKSDSIIARLSKGERVVPSDINAQLGGIPNELLPKLIPSLIQPAIPHSLGSNKSSATDGDSDFNPTLISRSVEESNTVVVSGLSAVVQRLDRLTSLMEQEVSLSGAIARKPAQSFPSAPSKGSNAAGAIGISPTYFSR